MICKRKGPWVALFCAGVCGVSITFFLLKAGKISKVTLEPSSFISNTNIQFCLQTDRRVLFIDRYNYSVQGIYTNGTVTNFTYNSDIGLLNMAIPDSPHEFLVNVPPAMEQFRISVYYQECPFFRSFLIQSCVDKDGMMPKPNLLVKFLFRIAALIEGNSSQKFKDAYSAWLIMTKEGWKMGGADNNPIEAE